MPVSKHQDKTVPHSSRRNWTTCARGPAYLFPSVWASDVGGFPPSLYSVPTRLPRRSFGGCPYKLPCLSDHLPASFAPQKALTRSSLFTWLQSVSCSMTITFTKTRNRLAFGHPCIPRAQDTAECSMDTVESVTGACFLYTIHLHTTGQSDWRSPWAWARFERHQPPKEI